MLISTKTLHGRCVFLKARNNSLFWEKTLSWASSKQLSATEEREQGKGVDISYRTQKYAYQSSGN